MMDENERAVIQFVPKWQTIQHGDLKQGGRLIIEYDPNRLPDCHTNFRGAEVGDIETAIKFHPGGQHLQGSVVEKIRMPPDRGMVVGLKPKPYEVSAPVDATQVEMWFRNFYRTTSFCEAWGSCYGQNYWFQVVDG